MLRSVALLFAALLLSAIPAPAVAHAGALVVPGPKRCYLFEVDGFQEFWVEANGITTGGVTMGLGTVNHQVDTLTAPANGVFNTWQFWQQNLQSGLQRSAADWDHDGDIDPPDQKVSDVAAWLQTCATP